MLQDLRCVLRVSKIKQVQILVIELTELKEALKRSVTDVETLLIWQENVQRSFGVSLARVIDIILEHIFARVKIEIEKEMMKIEDHQEDIEIEEDL